MQTDYDNSPPPTPAVRSAACTTSTTTADSPADKDRSPATATDHEPDSTTAATPATPDLIPLAPASPAHLCRAASAGMRRATAAGSRDLAAVRPAAGTRLRNSPNRPRWRMSDSWPQVAVVARFPPVGLHTTCWCWPSGRPLHRSLCHQLAGGRSVARGGTAVRLWESRPAGDARNRRSTRQAEISGAGL